MMWDLCRLPLVAQNMEGLPEVEADRGNGVGFFFTQSIDL